MDAFRLLLTHVDEAAKAHEKLMESSRQYCTLAPSTATAFRFIIPLHMYCGDAVLVEQQCAALPVVAAFSSYCQRSVAAHKVFGDCISVNAVDQLRMTRKAAKAVR